MAHIGSNNLSSGCIFPRKFWFDSGRDPEKLRPIQYDEFNRVFQGLFLRLLCRRGPFGLHSGRKTSYLLVTWYRVSLLDTMKAACYEAEVNAARYYRESGAILNLIKTTAEYELL